MNKCHFVGAFVVFLWFFYPDRKNGYFKKTLVRMDDFLCSLNFLEPKLGE